MEVTPPRTSSAARRRGESRAGSAAELPASARRASAARITCVMPVQSKVHGLFYDSLAIFGVLALGSRESLRFSPYEDCYEQLNGPEKIYRRVR